MVRYNHKKEKRWKKTSGSSLNPAERKPQTQRTQVKTVEYQIPKGREKEERWITNEKCPEKREKKL